jgi:hypothetical protein
MLVASIPTLLRGAHMALMRGSHGAAGRKLAADAGFAGVGHLRLLEAESRAKSARIEPAQDSRDSSEQI